MIIFSRKYQLKHSIPKHLLHGCSYANIIVKLYAEILLDRILLRTTRIEKKEKSLRSKDACCSPVPPAATPTGTKHNQHSSHLLTFGWCLKYHCLSHIYSFVPIVFVFFGCFDKVSVSKSVLELALQSSMTFNF